MTPERLARIKQTLDTRQPDLRVLTDQVHKPRNLSAIIRSCDAFGLANMHVVWPKAVSYTHLTLPTKRIV